MSALTETPYQDTRLFPPWGDYAASALFYFGAAGDSLHRLPVGAVFGVVYSPSPFCHAGWQYVRFEVRLCRLRAGHAPERGYAVSAQRWLTADEATFFDSEWKRLQEERWTTRHS